MSRIERKFFIAGVQHHDLHKVINELEEGDELELVPEPDNKYDPNAVKIQTNDTMLGYVPKKFSSEIAGALEIGTDLTCEITTLTPNAKPWEQCEVEIYEIEKEEEEENDTDDGYNELHEFEEDKE